MNSVERVKHQKSFDGWTSIYQHQAASTRSTMRFAVYTPPQASSRECPVVYFLAGLTCTEETFIIKAGAQRVASELGLILVAPDTSPRGTDVPDDSGSWDFGHGAGFYLNATAQPWSRNYRMYDYVVEELPEVVAQVAPGRRDRQGIMGHSMGGHGALVLGLRNPDRYQSISAFAPISAPTACPWGKKAFGRYLGSDESTWTEYDACHLVAKTTVKREILVDQGTDDEFLETQLMPERLVEACRAADYPLNLRMRDGYDHSYFFVSTFMEDHLRHHAGALSKP